MRRLARLVSWLLLAGMLLLGWDFSRFLIGVEAPAVEPGRRTDAIAALTGGGERVETALALLEQGLAPRLLVSGTHAGLTLADLARAHGRDAAALAGRVTLGRWATSTRGNAAEVADYARANNLSSVRVVTAGYHMPRALLEIRRAAPGLVLVPHPVTPAALRSDTEGGGISERRRWTLLSGEYLKYVAASAGLTRFLPERESARR